MASPGPSQSASVVHFFRQLSEPAQLRSHPLVSEIFANAPGTTAVERDTAAIAEIRRRIKVYADMCEQLDAGTRRAMRGKRHRTIVLRCDLAGEPHESVARDLGICIRHFYRERQAAQLRIAQLFSEERPWPKATVFDAHEAALAHASMLAEVGCSDAAVREFESAATAVDGERKVRALALLTDTFRTFGRIAQGAASLKAAGAEAAAVRDGGGSDTAHLWLRFVEGELLSEAGAFKDAERAFAQAAALIPHVSRTHSILADDATARATRSLTYHAYQRGASHEAVEHATAGLRVLDRSAHPMLLLRESLTHAQLVSLYQLGRLNRDETLERLRETLRFVQSAGSLEQAALLLCSLSVMEYAPRNDAYRLQACEIAARHGSLALQRHMHLATATWLLAQGQPSQAFAEMNAARKYGPGDVAHQIIALDVEAQASLSAGDLKSALAHSRRAHGLATAVGNQRARGAVMRTMAMLEMRLGHLHDARELIGEAIPVIANYGSPSSLNLALALRDRIARSAVMTG